MTGLTSKVPRSPADPRPGGKPYYIDSNCSTHSVPLVLIKPEPGELVWHDEFECPQCPDVIWMDWPHGTL